MKSIKHTLAAVAIIAAASFSNSAQAAAGDVVLGLYNSSTTLAIDLGAFSTLTAGETFNLGNGIENTLGTGALTFNIAASGNSLSAAGGLVAKQIAFTALTLPGSFPAANTTQITQILNYTNTPAGSAVTLGSTMSSNGTSLFGKTTANTTATSFQHSYNTGGNSGGYGLGTGLSGSFPDTTTLYTFYTLLSGSGNPVAFGTFQFSTDGSGNDILTFDPTSAPEPSAYALGLCALALFWVLKRRNATV